jgi:hypothetical protein
MSAWGDTIVQEENLFIYLSSLNNCQQFRPVRTVEWAVKNELKRL